MEWEFTKLDYCGPFKGNTPAVYFSLWTAANSSASIERGTQNQDHNF